MKTTILIALTTSTLLSACASPQELTRVSQNECSMLGYAETDARYLECVERGFRGQVQQQNQTANDVTTYLILEALF